jgi:hypothetical protein
MPKYVYAYRGGGGMLETPEAQAQAMQEWGAWFAGLGEAIVDGGNPFGPSRTVSADGTAAEGGASGLGGYSIVNADSLDAATELTKGCPVLAAGGSVEVYEGIPM